MNTRTLRRSRSWTVWLAALAMLWQALLPLSAASAAAGPGDRVPVCTSTGLKWMVVGDEAPAHQVAHDGQSHCALCYFDQDSPALHDARTPLAVPATGTVAQILHAAPLPHSIHLAAPPPSRGPPSYS